MELLRREDSPSKNGFSFSGHDSGGLTLPSSLISPFRRKKMNNAGHVLKSPGRAYPDFYRPPVAAGRRFAVQ
jgi:hypothetical protein